MEDPRLDGQTVIPKNRNFRASVPQYLNSDSGASVPQPEFFIHFIVEGHHGFMKDICLKIIDSLTGERECGKASGNIGWITLPLRV